MRDQTALGGLVVVRSNGQTCVRAAFSGELGQRDGIIGVIGAGAGDDGNTVVYVLAAPGQNLAVLLVVQGGGLAGRAADDDRISMMCDLVVDNTAELLVVYLTGGLERGDDRNTRTGKNRLLHSKNAPP